MSVGRWGPAAAWAACILVATWIPGAKLPRIPAPAGTDKVVHFLFFAVLGALVVAAMRARWSVRAPMLVLIAIAAFGAMDEYVQQFIPGRTMELFDWIADVTGAAVGIAIAARRTRAEREARP